MFFHILFQPITIWLRVLVLGTIQIEMAKWGQTFPISQRPLYCSICLHFLHDFRKINPNPLAAPRSSLIYRQTTGHQVHLHWIPLVLPCFTTFWIIWPPLPHRFKTNTLHFLVIYYHSRARISIAEMVIWVSGTMTLHQSGWLQSSMRWPWITLKTAHLFGSNHVRIRIADARNGPRKSIMLCSPSLSPPILCIRSQYCTLLINKTTNTELHWLY